MQNFKKENTNIRPEKVSIAVASRMTAIKWVNKEMSWSDIVMKLSDTVRTAETVADYKKMTSAQRTKTKDVGAFVGGMLKNGQRKNGSVAWRQLITLDADNAAHDLIDMIEMLHDFEFVAYSTHSHTPENPRLRFVIPLSRSVTPDEYQAIARKVADIIGMRNFDACSFRPAQLMFWPSTSVDGEFLYEHQEGSWLDADAILNEYNDWTDPLEWPQTEAEEGHNKKLADKQGDPLTKPGMIGAFNRAYSISEAIATFLSDVYEVTGVENRFTFVEGSTAGGLVTYNDEFAYSHHGTDPCADKLVNAFDMVRLHRFGSLDDESLLDTPVAKLPSTKAMKEFSTKDVQVKKLIVAEKHQRVSEDFTDFTEDEADSPAPGKELEWTKYLELNKQGDILPNALNITHIYKNQLAQCLKYDTFRGRLAVVKPFPWDTERKINGDGETFSDRDHAGMYNWFAKAYAIEKRTLIDDVLTYESSKSEYHPIREGIKSVEWDGVKRAETLFIDYLGVADNVYTREASMKWLLAAVSRAFNSGCKFDNMLVLAGAQGIGKSLIGERLALSDEFFSDSLAGLTDPKRSGELLQGYWIVEMAELSALKKADVESVKQFLSRKSDRYRPAYARHVSDNPRQCVLIGTTNEKTFLKDRTGNRRFWVLDCHADKRINDVYNDLTHEVVQQVWAEVYEAWKVPHSLLLSQEAAIIAEQQQADKTIEDVTYTRIEDWLLGLEKKPAVLTINMVAEEVLCNYSADVYERQRIVQAIESLGYEQATRNGVKQRKMIEGRKSVYWKLS